MHFYFFPFKYSRLPRYDRDLPIRQGEYETLPCIRVKGKPAVKLHLTAQPLIGKGEQFSLHIAAVDEYGNLDEDFTGTLNITSSDSSAILPQNVIISSKHKGYRTIKNLRLSTTGWHTIKISNTVISGESHLLLVTAQKPKNRLYFGDMHGHTIDGDGILTAKEHLDYACNVAGLDFASLAPHAEYFGTKQAWTRYLKEVSKANKPHEFVTFYGYEWAGQGHVNAYFLREKEVINIYGKRCLKGKHPKDNPSFRLTCNKERRFLSMLKSLHCQTFAISHYHSEYVNPVSDEILILHEVCSTHRNNPLEEKLKDILERSLKIGVVCGSDTHQLPVGHLCPDPCSLYKNSQAMLDQPVRIATQKKCCLQATFSPRLRRENLWKAMQARFTYGTTGDRIILLFELNGSSMGQEVTLEKEQKPQFRIKVGGTTDIQEISLVKYDGQKWSEPVRKINLHKRICDFSWKDKSLNRNSLYYVRVIQVDNAKAWSSPIWVRIKEDR